MKMLSYFRMSAVKYNNVMNERIYVSKFRITDLCRFSKADWYRHAFTASKMQAAQLEKSTYIMWNAQHHKNSSWDYVFDRLTIVATHTLKNPVRGLFYAYTVLQVHDFGRFRIKTTHREWCCLIEISKTIGWSILHHERALAEVPYHNLYC